nr:MAG TPA: hypothetical protein [Caudoviricetes sp.]
MLYGVKTKVEKLSTSKVLKQKNKKYQTIACLNLESII